MERRAQNILNRKHDDNERKQIVCLVIAEVNDIFFSHFIFAFIIMKNDIVGQWT